MLKEITYDQLKFGQTFLLSYWNGNKPISHWVEYVDHDIYSVYFRASTKIAPNRDPEKYRKLNHEQIRATFVEEK